MPSRATRRRAGSSATATRAGRITPRPQRARRPVLGDNAGARLGILPYTSGTQVTGVICDAFVSLTATCSGSWKITGSPRTTVTPAAKDPVGQATTLTLPPARLAGAP